MGVGAQPPPLKMNVYRMQFNLSAERELQREECSLTCQRNASCNAIIAVRFWLIYARQRMLKRAFYERAAGVEGARAFARVAFCMGFGRACFATEEAAAPKPAKKSKKTAKKTTKKAKKATKKVTKKAKKVTKKAARKAAAKAVKKARGTFWTPNRFVCSLPPVRLLEENCLREASRVGFTKGSHRSGVARGVGSRRGCRGVGRRGGCCWTARAPGGTQNMREHEKNCNGKRRRQGG